MNVIEWKDVLHLKARKDRALRSHCRSASAENVVIDPFIALQNQPPLLLNCSPWGHEESDTTERLHFHTLEKEMATHSSVLAWRILRTGEPGGLPSMGWHRVGHD